MAIVVRHDTVTVDTLTPLCHEKVVLIRMTGMEAGMQHEAHLLMMRVSGTVYVTLDTSLVLAVEDLATEEIIPLTANALYPREGMPLLAFGPLGDGELGPLRARAQQLVEIHGGAAPTHAVPGAKWRYSDTAHFRFGQELVADLVAVAGRMEIKGSHALVLEDGSWTTAQLVGADALQPWMEEKRGGAGRDPRLLPSSDAASSSRRRLFASVWPQMDASAPLSPLFTGVPAVEELCSSIAASGMEPPQYFTNYLAESGLNRRSGLATELALHFWTLWTMATMDQLDLRRSAAAEHICRRILQTQEAIKRNSQAPDFTGLEIYTRHAQECQGGAHAPRFRTFVASVMKDEAAYMKQTRLAKEEEEAVATRAKGGGNNKKKKGGKTPEKEE